MDSKDFYLSKISELSNRYGDKLLELMDRCKVTNLQEVSAAQAKEFYELLIVRKK